MESCFEDLRSKTFQWGKKGLLSKKRTKKGPIIELFRTLLVISVLRPKGLKKRVSDITHFATKSAYVHCGRTVVYNTYDPIPSFLYQDICLFSTLKPTYTL